MVFHMFRHMRVLCTCLHDEVHATEVEEFLPVFPVVKECEMGVATAGGGPRVGPPRESDDGSKSGGQRSHG